MNAEEKRRYEEKIYKHARNYGSSDPMYTQQMRIYNEWSGKFYNYAKTNSVEIPQIQGKLSMDDMVTSGTESGKSFSTKNQSTPSMSATTIITDIADAVEHISRGSSELVRAVSIESNKVFDELKQGSTRLKLKNDSLDFDNHTRKIEISQLKTTLQRVQQERINQAIAISELDNTICDLLDHPPKK